MNIASIPRKTLVYLGLVVVLVAVFVIQETTTSRRNTIPVPELGDGIDRIVMESPDGSVEIRKDGDAWVVGEQAYPANQDSIQSLIDQVAALGELDIISGRGSYKDYGLQDDTQRQIRFFAGDTEPLAIQLGDSASAGDAVYGRLNRSREVVLLPRSLDGRFVSDVADIRNHVMASVPEDSVVQIVIESPSQETRTVQRVRGGSSDDAVDDGDPVWELAPAPDATDAAAEDGAAEEISPGLFQNLFQELDPLRAQEFVDGDVQGEAFATLSVERTDGSTVGISLYPPDDQRRFPVTVTTSPYAFTVPEWRARRLLLGREAYFAPFNAPE